MTKNKLSKQKKVLRRIGIVALKILIVFFFLSLISVLALKWVDPFTSSVMMQKKISSLFSSEKSSTIHYSWVNYDDISGNAKLAVIAAEDQNFPYHIGFDFEQIGKAINENQRGKKMRGASTITQQVAKNLFLWNGKSFIRKGFEAYFTVLIEFFWSKRRILEVYLNITEMGNMIFGISASGKKYFERSAAKLTNEQAALIASILPNPLKYSAKNPSSYILKRKKWILNQMKSLGGDSYLEIIND
ncbi:MAG: monofunctional biosynthetic peptidoglycan transglycosylase [Ignavibacteria bacterium]|nr:monofunctional biosynthetic peptidoglycan transglycosylase [Ignavibacteria bacterium]